MFTVGVCGYVSGRCVYVCVCVAVRCVCGKVLCMYTWGGMCIPEDTA